MSHGSAPFSTGRRLALGLALLALLALGCDPRKDFEDALSITNPDASKFAESRMVLSGDFVTLRWLWSKKSGYAAVGIRREGTRFVAEIASFDPGSVEGNLSLRTCVSEPFDELLPIVTAYERDYLTTSSNPGSNGFSTVSLLLPDCSTFWSAHAKPLRRKYSYTLFAHDDGSLEVFGFWKGDISRPIPDTAGFALAGTSNGCLWFHGNDELRCYEDGSAVDLVTTLDAPSIETFRSNGESILFGSPEAGFVLRHEMRQQTHEFPKLCDPELPFENGILSRDCDDGTLRMVITNGSQTGEYSSDKSVTEMLEPNGLVFFRTNEEEKNSFSAIGYDVPFGSETLGDPVVLDTSSAKVPDIDGLESCYLARFDGRSGDLECWNGSESTLLLERTVAFTSLALARFSFRTTDNRLFEGCSLLAYANFDGSRADLFCLAASGLGFTDPVVVERGIPLVVDPRKPFDPMPTWPLILNPKEEFLVTAPSGRILVVTSEDSEYGVLEDILIDREEEFPKKVLDRNVLSESAARLGSPRSVVYLRKGSRGNDLVAYLTDSDLVQVVHENVAEFIYPPSWFKKAPFVLYRIEGGDDAGIWIARPN